MKCTKNDDKIQNDKILSFDFCPLKTSNRVRKGHVERRRKSLAFGIVRPLHATQGGRLEEIVKSVRHLSVTMVSAGREAECRTG
jgi:hypothetical protein